MATFQDNRTLYNQCRTTLNIIVVFFIAMVQVLTLYGDHIMDLVKSIPFDQSLRYVFHIFQLF